MNLLLMVGIARSNLERQKADSKVIWVTCPFCNYVWPRQEPERHSSYCLLASDMWKGANDGE